MEKEEDYKEGEEYNMCLALQEMLKDCREEGKAEGRVEGEEMMLALANILADQNRLGDLKKIQVDVEYRKKLYLEFHL